ncbi:hypothetical protein SAMN05443247_06906 [Bradyrhizobium erythrophlei]|nr:hypothetical protein SAMN05443247_06906 [Bradyrhizobium erythrophlei]
MTAFPSYSTGTVSVTAGGTVVTGVSTIWSGVNARPGDMIQIGSGLALIADVTDTTHLVIPPWGGSTVSTAAYTIYQTSPLRFAGGQAMQDVSTLVAALNATGFIFFVGAGLSAPDPSYGNNGQYATQTTTNTWWLKSAGVWTLTIAPIVGYGGTSATSLTIGTGSKVFTTQPNLAYNGARVRAASASGPANYMEGVCTYSGTTLTMTADGVGGSGTKTDWLFSIAGQPGNMLGSNNLSDVASPIAARDNLAPAHTTIASAATVNLDAATSELIFISGATGITAMTLADGKERTLIFQSNPGPLFTHSANLYLRGVNIQAQQNDIATFRGVGAGQTQLVQYQRRNLSDEANDIGAVSSANAQTLTAGQKSQAQANIYVAPTIQKFTSGSGTYTTPAGVTHLRVRMVGGGGGGTGSGTTNPAGGTGGSTTFGAHTAGGGSPGGGIGGGVGGFGTIGAGGVGIIIPGGGGGGGNAQTATNQVTTGGMGGTSMLGGGQSGPTYNGAGTAPAQAGGGGSGGGSANVNGSTSGGGGGAAGGLDIIIPSPAASISYAIGAAGTPGAAGTSGLPGGAGAPGELIVEEHYGS